MFNKSIDLLLLVALTIYHNQRTKQKQMSPQEFAVSWIICLFWDTENIIQEFYAVNISVLENLLISVPVNGSWICAALKQTWRISMSERNAYDK